MAKGNDGSQSSSLRNHNATRTERGHLTCAAKLISTSQQLEGAREKNDDAGYDNTRTHPQQLPRPERDRSVGDNGSSLKAGHRGVHEAAQPNPAEAAGHLRDDLLRRFSQLRVALHVSTESTTHNRSTTHKGETKKEGWRKAVGGCKEDARCVRTCVWRACLSNVYYVPSHLPTRPPVNHGPPSDRVAECRGDPHLLQDLSDLDVMRQPQEAQGCPQAHRVCHGHLPPVPQEPHQDADPVAFPDELAHGPLQPIVHHPIARATPAAAAIVTAEPTARAATRATTHDVVTASTAPGPRTTATATAAHGALSVRPHPPRRGFAGYRSLEPYACSSAVPRRRR